MVKVWGCPLKSRDLMSDGITSLPSRDGIQVMLQINSF